MEYFTVSQINKYISDIFYSEMLLHNVSIYGEVSGFKISGKHAYFTLKDENSALQIACFNYAKTYTPKNGETVIIKGSPNYYSKMGKFSYVANFIEPVGKGLIYLKILELKENLEKEGLFSPEFKKSFNPYSQNIAVITSKTGAVIQDIISTTRRKNPFVNITLKDVKVQGVGASKEIIEAIKIVDNLNFDVIILARGGGSYEDLMPFNDEGVARAIFNAKTPIISAVGHETDTSISDLVADFRAETPTAGAELAVFDFYQVKEFLENFNLIAKNSLNKKINLENQNIKNLIRQLEISINNKLTDYLDFYENQRKNLVSAVNNKYYKNMNYYLNYSDKISDLYVKRFFKNSYFIYKNGEMINSLNNLNIGDNISINSENTLIEAKVTKKVEK